MGILCKGILCPGGSTFEDTAKLEENKKTCEEDPTQCVTTLEGDVSTKVQEMLTQLSAAATQAQQETDEAVCLQVMGKSCTSASKQSKK